MADTSITPEWLERANRLAMTAALLSTTIHEVNNALQIITGNAEMLSDKDAPHLIARRSDAIGVQARRASALLADLSGFARDDSAAKTRLDLGQLGERALAMRRYTIARLQLEAAFETAGTARVVVAQSRELLQVVVNLIVNAERALAGTRGGVIGVTVTGTPERVELSVVDNGPGVPADIVPTLFEPAVHASAVSLGIGLAVSRRLAERNGGTLTYEPRRGGGAVFTVAIPVAK